MNFWKQNPHFWKEKSKNPNYDKQKTELGFDIGTLIQAHNIKTVIDVCGYDGSTRKYLPKNIEYISLDIVDGFDVTYDWAHQMIEKNIVIDPKTTLAFTSLSLLCFRPEATQHIINQMRKYSFLQYYYEEKTKPELLMPETDISAQVNSDFGGKWTYDWEKFIGDVDIIDSEIGPWVRIFSR